MTATRNDWLTLDVPMFLTLRMRNHPGIVLVLGYVLAGSNTRVGRSTVRSGSPPARAGRAPDRAINPTAATTTARTSSRLSPCRPRRARVVIVMTDYLPQQASRGRP